MCIYLLRSCFTVERRRCHRYLSGEVQCRWYSTRRALSFKKVEYQRAIKVMIQILNFSFSNKFAHATITAFFENSCRLRDDSPVFSYRFARARYLVSSLDGSFNVSLAALTIPVMA